MEINSLIQQLELNTNVFQSLLMNSTREDQIWKPSSDKWCLLEIISHLYDEEMFDFKPRLAKILNEDHNWDPIDPQGWVNSRNYMKNEFHETLGKFIEERIKSVEWLKNLDVKDWNIKAVHPKFGEFTAVQMLGNWLAHDYIHIRQILNLKYQILQKEFNKDDLKYAGEW